MEVVIVDSPSQVAQEAASRVLDYLHTNPTANIGLATGSTQQGIYQLLIDAYNEGRIDFGKNHFFQLDEYLGVPETSPTSFQHVLKSHFLEHVGVADGVLQVLDGNADDLESECSEFEHAIASAGGIDLQLLGIGRNGHIGFNEPGSAFDSRTRVVELQIETVQSNSHYFESEDRVPRHAITQGLATIMAAKFVLLIATGEAKAPALASMLCSPQSVATPASILQQHPNLIVILDKAAARDLP